MVIKKVVNHTVDVNINIKKVSLLSQNEIRKLRDNILDNMILSRDHSPWAERNESVYWWTRSSERRRDERSREYVFTHPEYVMKAQAVSPNCLFVTYTVNEKCGVRPAFFCDDLSSMFKIGDKVYISGERCTVISDTIILCDNIVGYTEFRKDITSPDATDFSKSDLKVWVREWWKENKDK